MIKEAVNDYLDGIYEFFSSGQAREESYYTILETFIRQVWKIAKKGEPQIIIMPKKTDAGNPDMVIRAPGSRLVGYIEAKDVTRDLDEMEDCEQVMRYREVFPNFILTNFLEFRFYRSGRRVDFVSIAKQKVMTDVGLKPYTENHEKCLELFKDFFSFALPRSRDARELAEALAVRTRFFRDHVVMQELNDALETGETGNHIAGFYNAFKTYLIHGLSKEEFADLYSQTLTFGLFAAAVSRKGKIKRETAVRYIPQTGGILHDVFAFISMGNIQRQLECSINDIIEVLNSADSGRVLSEYYRYGKGDDPVIHFYETFLSRYDPRLREKRGVYYTPEAAVSFIVRSIHTILKQKLNRPEGLADPGVKILDPAAGTSTFLAKVAQLAVDEDIKKYGKGDKMHFIRDFLLNNLYGFEELMAPYAVAHLKMSYILDKAGFKLKANERFNLYLTNTLEMEEIEQSNLPGMSTLSSESLLACKIKKETPVTVILGNPPYAGHSLNNSETRVKTLTRSKKTKWRTVKTWIGELIEDYKQVNGKGLGERNLKWLQDDYVKFIRFAQAKIDENGEGVIGFITNHGYLDNPTFRGMRRSLLGSFDEIYILDLHGNALKKEKCPDGSRDENIFDIRQGVAVAFFVKRKRGETEEKECQVFHADMWGLRKEKYRRLAADDIDSIDWRPVSPRGDFYLFTPAAAKIPDPSGKRYSDFHLITEIFPVHSVGIVTARDRLTIKKNRDEMYRTVSNFTQYNEGDARGLFGMGEDTRDWQVARAQKDIVDSGVDYDKVVPILYRPFERRFTYYTGRSRGFHCMPRPDVMKHMLKENIAMITVRQVAEGQFNHCFIADTIVESRVTSSNKGVAYVFPLYLYTGLKSNGAEGGGLFAQNGKQREKSANIDPRLIKQLTRTMGLTSGLPPEQIFYYIYAILFSSVYRKKYAAHLGIDFPRIPFTPDHGLFLQLVELGKKLIGLHLFQSPELNETFTRFEVSGENRVTRLRHVEIKSAEGVSTGRLYINDIQYFSGVPLAAWKYKLCGYQVLAKWLKIRKGRVLHHPEIKHFIKIVRCICLTIDYQKQIDRLYPRVEETRREN
jgi:DNA-binding Xre family transcriptional regulator